MIHILIHILLCITKLVIRPLRFGIILMLESLKNFRKEKNYISLCQFLIVFSSMNEYNIPIEKHLVYIFLGLCHLFHLFYVLWSMSKKGTKIISLVIVSILSCLPNKLYNVYNVSWHVFLIRLVLFRIIVNRIRKIKNNIKDQSRWLWIFFVHEYALVLIIPQLIIEIYYI